MLLLKLAGRRLTGAQLAALAGELGAGAADGPLAVQGYAGVDTEETYVYCRLSAQGRGPGAALLARARRAFPDAAAQWLRRVSDIPGASAGKAAPWHYIVETDVLPEADQDLNDWYDKEHLPGLAGVPGTVRAERFACDEGSPRYHACYDLETRETFGSPPWLAVRASAWSDRVRPSFRNTKRTMFRAIAS
ncbi:hypothetical protein CAL12_17520 [Bordetella genomosp. 8]|uniref:Uncharacterized protein n=1 Tax=Bordetella genomosp. 8 TaxID=1416806 RepID=A0A1W6YU31_9BORD|nr:hypothetical protein CAL12_17520 [Bordetella genomosp. 8]